MALRRVFPLFGQVTTQNIFSITLNASRCLTRNNVFQLHTTTNRLGVMEFFDDSKNMGATEVKSGRSWTLDELRLKSNVDLHKLWYVLLKERNMLLTMEHNSREACRLFPSPERIDKVQDSMDRLEEVVRERNEAFWQLEVGEEAPKGKTERILDPNDPLATVREPIKAVLDGIENRRAGIKFKFLIKEKEMKMQTKLLRRQKQEAMMLLKMFPKLDMEALQAKYPDIDINKLKVQKKTLGNHEFNTA